MSILNGTWLGTAAMAVGLAVTGGAQAEVTVLGWPGGPEETALRAAVEVYNARADVAEDDRVELLFFSRDGFWDKLQTDLVEVPRFLEDYGDTFLSLAYFKQCLDDIVPKVMEFLENLPILQKNYQLQNTHGFVSTCDAIDKKLNNVITSITGRFESFDRHSKDMWNNISAESYREVRRMITEHHATVGGVLCGLSVKIDAWDDRFGSTAADSAMVRKAEFVMGEMQRGLEKIEAIEASAPQMAASAVARMTEVKPASSTDADVLEVDPAA